MSRIGNKPIPLPKGVKINLAGRDVTVESSKARLSITHRPEVTVRVDEAGAQIIVERKSNGRIDRAMHGLTRALINNMVVGVTEGFKKELEISGVGWTANVQGKQIALNVGYADTRKVTIPDGVTVDIKGNKITISGPDKHAVGQLAAVVRSQRPPEPYNAKGIKYADEQIVRKQGKAFAGGGA